jgi:hypothetical protein
MADCHSLYSISVESSHSTVPVSHRAKVERQFGPLLKLKKSPGSIEAGAGNARLREGARRTGPAVLSTDGGRIGCNVTDRKRHVTRAALAFAGQQLDANVQRLQKRGLEAAN